MPQTTITYPLVVGIAGALADVSWNDVLTIVNTGTANLGFGLAVMTDAAAHGDQAGKSYDGTASVLGVVMYSNVYDNGPGGLLDTTSAVQGLKPGAVMSILKKGRIYVLVEETVAKGDRGFIRKASGSGGTLLGAFRKSADTATAVDATKNVEFVTAATAGNLAVAEVNFFNI